MKSILSSDWHTMDPIKVKVCVWMLGPGPFKDRTTLWAVGKQMEAFEKPWLTLSIAQISHCWLFFPRPEAETAQYPLPWLWEHWGTPGTTELLGAPWAVGLISYRDRCRLWEIDKYERWQSCEGSLGQALGGDGVTRLQSEPSEYSQGTQKQSETHSP